MFLVVSRSRRYNLLVGRAKIINVSENGKR
jgi:hypothetical protein